jgi:hypothetical protein
MCAPSMNPPESLSAESEALAAPEPPEATAPSPPLAASSAMACRAISCAAAVRRRVSDPPKSLPRCVPCEPCPQPAALSRAGASTAAGRLPRGVRARRALHPVLRDSGRESMDSDGSQFETLPYQSECACASASQQRVVTCTGSGTPADCGSCWASETGTGTHCNSWGMVSGPDSRTNVAVGQPGSDTPLPST